MSWRHRTGWLGVLASVVLFGGRAGGQTDDFKPDPGYTSLFNGRELNGWQYVIRKGEKEPCDGKTETSDRRFQALDGTIVVNERDANGRGGVKELQTTRNYDRDFHLKLEFLAADRADSGVYIRGKQLQVRDYPTVGPYRDLKNFRAGGWNVLEITVRGASAECRCNGELLEAAFPVPAKGAIGLQAEQGRFAFRRIQVKELP
jgi:hypothetical protein